MNHPRSIKRVASKAWRRARRNGPRSEFIIMCEGIQHRELIARDRAERMHAEAVARRAAQSAFAA